MHGQRFAKMDPTTEACVCMSTLIIGWSPPPFLTPGKPSCSCTDREVFLDLRRGHSISLLQQVSASATSFVLGVCAWEKPSILLHLMNTSSPAGASSISFLRERGDSTSYDEASVSPWVCLWTGNLLCLHVFLPLEGDSTARVGWSWGFPFPGESGSVQTPAG